LEDATEGRFFVDDGMFVWLKPLQFNEDHAFPYARVLMYNEPDLHGFITIRESAD
jgi:hypothetical protein